MNTLENKAHLFALRAHQGQTRKYTGEPYIVHPEAVARKLKELELDEEAIAAALLHDVVEDCGITLKELEDTFGLGVSNLVLMMTDNKIFIPSLTRKERKRRMINTMIWAQGIEGINLHNLKLADLLDNAYSIKEYDKDFWKVFKKEAEDLLKVATLAYPSLKDELCDILEIERLSHDRWRLDIK